MNIKSIIKRAAALVSALAIASAITGCSSDTETKTSSSVSETTNSSSETKTPETETVTIRVADQSAFTVLYFHYAYDKGILDKNFADYNVKFEVINSESGPAVNEAIASNQVDFAILGNLPSISGSANGYGSKIIAIGAEAGESSLTLAVPINSDINSFADLKGKTVGVAIGTAYHLMLSQALSLAGLALDDINNINLTPADGVTAIRNNSVDAACVLAAQATQLVEEGSAKTINSNLPQQPSSFIVGREEFINEYPEYTEALLKALNETFELIESDWDAFGEYYDEFIGGDASALVASMKKSDYGIQSITGSNKESLDYVLNFAIENGLVTNTDVKYDDIVDDSFAKNAGF